MFLRLVKLPTLKAGLPALTQRHAPSLDVRAGATARDTGQRYRRIRREVLVEGEYRCVNCGAVRLDNQVDHIVPLARGGSMKDKANLAVLCARCNAAKADAMPIG